jgi:hypothetical protein
VHRSPFRFAAIVLALSTCLPRAASAQSSSTPPRGDPFARGAWTLEFLGQGLAEAWNYNGNHENLYGGSTGVTYGVRGGLMLVAATPMFVVTQRTSDAALIAVTGGVRKRLVGKTGLSGFVEIAVGVSRAESSVPPRGTQFNYAFQPGVGVTIPIGHGARIVAGIRWLHLSNGGIAGRDRNPDIEAIGVSTGILLPF